jgi:hypothetical protein
MIAINSGNEDFKRIYDILQCRGEEYGKLYTKINEPNVFSISRLSATNSLVSAVNDKLRLMNGYSSYNASIAMTRGKAMHEFLQKRLINWQIEKEILFQPEGKNYFLFGHIDAVSPDIHVIYDFKNTSQECGSFGFRKIVESGKIQVGTYIKILEIQNNIKITGYLAIISNHALFMYALEQNDIDRAYNIILVRANFLYDELVKAKIIKT